MPQTVDPKNRHNEDILEKKLYEVENDLQHLKLLVETRNSPNAYRLTRLSKVNEDSSSDLFSVSTSSVSNSNSPSPSIFSFPDTTTTEFENDESISEFQSSSNNSFENGQKIRQDDSTPKNHSSMKKRETLIKRNRIFSDLSTNYSYKVTRPNSRNHIKNKPSIGSSPKFLINGFGLQYQIDDENIKVSFKNIFDSHCHIDRIFHKHRRELNLQNTRSPPACKALETLHSDSYETNSLNSKFEGCITVCCDVERWKDNWYNWLTKEDNVWVTYGCHPANADTYDDLAECELIKFLKYPKVCALGEIGLDETFYFRKEGPNLETQQRVFRRQLKIAKTSNKAICIHLRAAEDNSMVWKLAKQMLLESGLPRDWKIHMHCFNHTLDNALEWLREFPNMKFGLISNNFKKDVGLKLNLSHILLETDAPYFSSSYAPSSKSIKNISKFSIPARVLHVAVQIAKIRSISVDEVLSANRSNIDFVYGIPYETNKVAVTDQEVKKD